MTETAYVHDVTTATFEAQVLQASQQHPVLVDFWAPWCGPCQSLSPLLEKLAAEYAGAFTVAKINTDDEQALAAQFGIRSLPTVVLVHQGQIVDHFMGLQQESFIREMLERHVGPADSAGTDAAAAEPSLLDQLNPEQAVVALRQQLEAEPDKPELKLELATALTASGALTEAQQLFDSLPSEVRDGETGKTVAARLQFSQALAADDNVPADPKQLASQVESAPDDLPARYRLGAYYLLNDNAEAGLQQFFEIMKRNRQFEDDLGRRSLVAAFALLANTEPELVSRFRQRMTSLLF